MGSFDSSLLPAETRKLATKSFIMVFCRCNLYWFLLPAATHLWKYVISIDEQIERKATSSVRPKTRVRIDVRSPFEKVRAEGRTTRTSEIWPNYSDIRDFSEVMFFSKSTPFMFVNLNLWFHIKMNKSIRAGSIIHSFLIILLILILEICFVPE